MKCDGERHGQALNVDLKAIAKTFLLLADERPIAAAIRGDRKFDKNQAQEAVEGE